MDAKTTDIRTFDVQIRAETGLKSDDSQNIHISGVAAVFNQPSIKGDFTEYIDQNALDGVDLSQILLLYSHDFGNILARADAGTLQTSIEPDGLHFEATLPDTQLGRDTFTNIQNGNIRGMSFGFTIADGGHSWSVNAQGNTIHTINQIEQVYELSLTPIPAYSETSVQVKRDFEQLINGGKNMADKPNEEKEKEPVTPVTPEAPDTKPADAQDTPSADLLNKTMEKLDELSTAISGLAQKFDADAEPDEPGEVEEVEPEPDVDDKEEQDKGDKKDMAKNLTEDKVKDEETRNFQDFLKTGEIKRDAAGFDSAAGEAVLPVQVLDVMSQPKDPAQLGGYVTKVQVSAPTGKIPVLSKASAQLVSAAELADNPKLANATLTQVNYDVQTLRGALPISLEMTQDYPNITSLLTQYINDIKDQTEQHKIGAVLQTATPVTATSIDDIKDAFNLGLSNYSDRMFVVSESFFAAIDKQKDAEGRYLLQDSITSPSGKQLFGAPLVVVADDVLGNAGDAKAFVGSLKNYVVETVRGNINLSWQRNENFEQVLLAALRADFKAADTAAGKFITYTAPAGE